MRMNTFELKVIAIDKTFFTGKCQQVIVSATDGSIGIMAHHENTVMALVEGPMRIQLEDGSYGYWTRTDCLQPCYNSCGFRRET